MEKILLGKTDIEVSTICLGTMTFGSQTDEKDSHSQLDIAISNGVNFIDTATMYPVNPISKETIGRTEEIIGSWLNKKKQRQNCVLATKMMGEGSQGAIKSDPISSKSLRLAVEESLRRLKTDYIDLFQLHWPNRGSYMFRKNWNYDPSSQSKDETISHMGDTLGAVQELISAGKIRQFGLSNESAWGSLMWLQTAERMKLPRVQTIQNEYSLLCRLYDTDLAELSVNEDVTLMGFSPLAAGYLTGKYQDGVIPKRSRMSINDSMGGRATPRVLPAIQAYLGIAEKYNLNLIHMSLAWFKSKPFKAIPIVGATTKEQLEYNIENNALVLNREILDEIDAVHKMHPMPY